MSCKKGNVFSVCCVSLMKGVVSEWKSSNDKEREWSPNDVRDVDREMDEAGDR